MSDPVKKIGNIGNPRKKGMAVIQPKKRGKVPKLGREPKDVREFQAEITKTVRDLDFALVMYFIELEQQGFTEDEIIKHQQDAFFAAIKLI